MIFSFENTVTEDVFNRRNTKAARKTCAKELWNIAARKLDQIDSAENLQDLRIPPVNRLKLLSGDRKRQYSIRINEQNRIYFQWSDQEPTEVEFADYH